MDDRIEVNLSKENIQEIINAYEKDIRRIEYLLMENEELNESITWWSNRFKAAERDKKLLKENIIRATHRIQLLQMEGEVSVRDLGLIARDLQGNTNREAVE